MNVYDFYLAYKTMILAMGNEAACDELRKYFSWATQVLAFFFFSAGKLLYIYSAGRYS